MKIGSPAEKPAVPNTAATPATPATPSNPRAAAEVAAHAQQPAEASAQVALSTTAAKLLSGAGGAAGEFDAEKVARISDAIERGEFKINAEVIADKLIANAAEVLNNASAKA